MSRGVIAKRYAKAFLDFAKDAKTEDVVYQEMKNLLQNFLTYEELRIHLRNPVISSAQKLKLLSVASSEKNLSVTTQRFFNFILEKNKGEFIQFIASSYLSLYQEEKNLLTAEVLLPGKVSKESMKELLKIISTYYPEKTIELKQREDASLIGGFILNIDNSRLDVSVSGSLKKMKKELNLN